MDIWSKVIGIKDASGATGTPGVHGADLEMLTQQYYREVADQNQRYDQVSQASPPSHWDFIKAVVGKFFMWAEIAAGLLVAVEAGRFLFRVVSA